MQIEPLLEQRVQKEAERESGQERGGGGAGGSGNNNRGRKSGTSRSNSGTNGTSKRVSRAKSGPRPQQNGGGITGNRGGTPGMVPVSQMEEMQRQMKLMQETIVMLQRQNSRTEVNLQTQYHVKNEEKPISEKEKVELRNGIQELPAAKMMRVLEIIKERNSTLDEHDQEVTIDMDALDVATLRQLQRYVRSCKKSERSLSNNDSIQQHQQPSPGLPDLDMDVSNLEVDALLMDEADGGNARRGRSSSDMALDSMSFSQSDIPAVDASDEEAH